MIYNSNFIINFFHQLSYADFALFAILDNMSQHAPEGVIAKFPSLKHIFDNFQKIDEIAKYLAIRPTSQ